MIICHHLAYSYELIDKNNKMAARVGPTRTRGNSGQCCIGNRGMVEVMYSPLAAAN